MSELKNTELLAKDLTKSMVLACLENLKIPKPSENALVNIEVLWWSKPEALNDGMGDPCLTGGFMEIAEGTDISIQCSLGDEAPNEWTHGTLEICYRGTWYKFECQRAEEGFTVTRKEPVEA